ncbi:hypothetical protein [Bosea sp. (in: a-proteobacteria)]|jgi:hypothetical protein|uniref:hypothetical protein n=1 Tax=Bosea sp. (in: a-proteobacteria) TaxID=1871050 RepID=UPI003F708301
MFRKLHDLPGETLTLYIDGVPAAAEAKESVAGAEARTVPDVGLYRARPPLKPVTLGELAGRDTVDAAS